MAEKQEEIERLEVKVKEMSQLNSTYIAEIESLKSQLLNKNLQLREESSKHETIFKELSLLQSHVAEMKTVPSCTKFLVEQGYFTLTKKEVNELSQLFELIQSTVQQLQVENQSLKDENNNFKLTVDNFNNQTSAILKENNELKSELNLVEGKVKSIIANFSGHMFIDDINKLNTCNLIDFAAEQFGRFKTVAEQLSNKNTTLEENLSKSNKRIYDIKTVVFNDLDNILQTISIMDVESSTEIENRKKQLSETIKENVFLKLSIQEFDKLMYDCVELVEQLKTNQYIIVQLQEDFAICNTVKNELEIQIKELNKLNSDLNVLAENQTKAEKENQEKLNTKSFELNDALTRVDEMQMIIKDNETKISSTADIVNQLNIELQTTKSNLEDKSKLIIELEEVKSVLVTKYNEVEKNYQSNSENLEEKEKSEKKLQEELTFKTNELKDSLIELEDLKIKIEFNISEMERMNTELEEKSKLIIEMENTNLDLINKCVEFEQISQLKEIKLHELTISENLIREEFSTKSMELENVLSQVNVLKSTVEEMNIETKSHISIIENLNCELDEKSKLIEEFEHSKCENLKEVEELNNVLIKLKSELEEKLNNEELLRKELQIVTVELEDTFSKANDVRSVINTLNSQNECNVLINEQLNNELQSFESKLNAKNSLIEELRNTNSDLLSTCNNSEETNQLTDTIATLKLKLEEQIKIENELHLKLHAKTLQLEDACIRENEVQTLVESMENEIQSNISLIEHLKSELLAQSHLSTELEQAKSELLNFRCNGIIDANLTHINGKESCIDLQGELQSVIDEKTLLQGDLNKVNQKCLELTKQLDNKKLHLENKIQLQALSYQKLFDEFNNLSRDIESLLKLNSETESQLREEILLKSTELDDLQKQMCESSLRQDFDKLEEEYMLKTHEVEEVREKIKSLESILSTKEESEKILRNNYKTKCNELNEYKKNVEFLCLRNDSLQVRVNDFEDEVLVDLNEEFDSIKLELAIKTESEKLLLEEKLELECNLNEVTKKLVNTTNELVLSEERSEDLASIINVLVIEIKDANCVKENIESRLNEAEHELIKSGDLVESLKRELYMMQRELENACINVESMEKELHSLEQKFNDKIKENDLGGSDVRNQLIDPLVDYVHDIKLKLTELNSAMISGNQSEKRFRTKVMMEEDDILSLDETYKVNCDFQTESPDVVEVHVEIENLQKTLEDKMALINSLQEIKNELEKNINELQGQVQNLCKENNKLVNGITLVENDLKEKVSLINDLNDELIEIKKQCIELQEHNHANKDQIHYSLDVDLELRDGKKNIVNEINLLEPGKITGVVTHHNLSNLLDTFVSLIMTKEQQIVTNLMNDNNKIKQQYEDQIKQFQEDIKKGKEWQEQVESDNDKLCLELESLKSQKHNFPSRETEIKELKEKVLEAENQSFNYLSELQELKSQFSKASEQNYQALSNEFEVFKTSSEQSIQDLKKKLEDLTNKYEESLSMYKDQKHSRSTLEGQIEKIQAECDCLKAILEKKDEDIRNLIDKVELKTTEYKTLIEKNSHQKEEMKEIHGKKIDELQLELNEKNQIIHCTEKSLKEANKKYNELVEENSLNLLSIQNLQDNGGSAVNTRISELECLIQTITTTNKTNLERIETEVKSKTTKLEESQEQCSKLLHELEVFKLKIVTLEKQVESCYETLKLKDDQIENYQTKSKMNENNSVQVNQVVDQLSEILKCSGTSLPMLYEKLSSLVTKCECLEEEIEDLKLTNVNLDNECESMLIELKNKDDKIVEFLTQEDELRHNLELVTEERDFLKNKCEQVKNVNDDVKKLNEEISSYEQSIYQLRREKGQMIVQHDKELKQVKTELEEKNNLLKGVQNEYNKLSGQLNMKIL